MQQFYFNECFLVNISKQVILERFSNTLRELNTLLEKDIGVDRSIITEKPPLTIALGPYADIHELIMDMPDMSLRNLAFSLFIKSPIHEHFELQESLVDEILLEEYPFTCGGLTFDGTNIAITHANGAYLFTTATHSDLERNSLSCGPGTSGKLLEIDNLYGEESNTAYIEAQIRLQEEASLGLWEQLLSVIVDANYTTSFERDFHSLTLAQQLSVVEGFRQAKNRKLASPFYPDTKLIADVTPQNSKSTVLELRIYVPTAIRVYFNEQYPKVYLVGIQKKSSPDQSGDIKRADNRLYKLIKTGS